MADFDDYSLNAWPEDGGQVPEEDLYEQQPARRRGEARHSRETQGGWETGSAGAWRTWRKVLIPVAALLLVAVAILGTGFVYASRVAKLTTIYPNVVVNGVPVGGMTVDEAAAALGDAPGRYDNAAITVNFPSGDSVTVTARDLGLQAVDGAAYARVAYSYGRSGSMLANLRAYRACQAKPVELSCGGRTAIDENALAALIRPVAESVDKKMSTVKAEIGQDQISVVKNLGTSHVDVPALCAQLREAFEREDYAPIDYQMPAPAELQPGETSAVDVDGMLQTLYNKIYVQPVNAEYDQATGSVREGTAGVRFDMDAARAAWEQAPVGGTVTIPLIREQPEVTAETLSTQLFRDVLAEKSTSLSGSTSARINNITLAAKAMNGTVLQPGQEFNYNACLGERTAAKGYQSAGAFSGGQHVMSIGGGICQGSSTLYYCALKANLRITDRWCHQFLVSYLPRGMDATVSWGWPDFKFVNSRDYPIKIEAWVSDGYLTVRILGTDVDGSYVEITNDTWEDATHYYAQTYRNVYDRNGNLISSVKEAYSSYDKEGAVASSSNTSATQAPEATQAPAVQEPAVQEPAVQQPEAPPAIAPDPIPETPAEPAVPDAPAAPEGEISAE